MDRIITVEEVVANASTILPKADEADRNLMRQWAYMGAREILHNKADIETEEIAVTNLIIPKPIYFIKAVELALYDSYGNDLHYRFQQYKKDRIHIKRSYEYRDDTTYPMITVSEQENAYILDSFYGDEVTQAFLRYYKLPVDPDTDEPYYYSEQLLALTFYIRWMYFLRYNDRVSAEQAKADWLRERHACRMRQKMPDGLEMKEIVRGWNSMIQKKFHDTF